MKYMKEIKDIVKDVIGKYMNEEYPADFFESRNDIIEFSYAECPKDVIDEIYDEIIDLGTDYEMSEVDALINEEWENCKEEIIQANEDECDASAFNYDYDY